jgi:predicted enzyme related to lactoylglutathione lyase
MPSNVSKFVWYDLMTTDIQSAERFYGSVIGWTAADSGQAESPYILFSMGDMMVAGLMPVPERAKGAHPVWMGYLGVDDVDAYAARVKEAGGAIHRAATEIPNIGRFAVVADPQGATFILFKGNSEAPVETPTAVGHVGWNELYAPDGDAAFSFYADHFGWKEEEAMDMKKMGIYHIFSAGGPRIGGVMTKTPEIPAPMWLFYFNVDAIDAAAERVKEGGGKVINGPHKVPTGQWIIHCLDPQEAMFALVAPKR